MGKKILLADDSITIQKVIELTFSDEDFDVVTVGNGRLAIDKVQEVRPDIVLCDIIMPEKDGYEVCEFVKKHPALSHVPVLLLTGAFEPFDQERAARVGCDGFLAKPFEPQTLIAKVKDLLNQAAARGLRAAAAAAPLPAPAPAPLHVAPAPAVAAPAPPAPPPSFLRTAAEPMPAAEPPRSPAPAFAGFEAAPEPAFHAASPQSGFPDDMFEADAGVPTFADAMDLVEEDAAAPLPAEEPEELYAVDDALEAPAEDLVSFHRPAPAAVEPLAPVGAAPLDFDGDEGSPWAEPAVEMPLEAHAQASVEAQFEPDAPVFEEVFDDAGGPLDPGPPAPALAPAAAPVPVAAPALAAVVSPFERLQVAAPAAVAAPAPAPPSFTAPPDAVEELEETSFEDVAPALPPASAPAAAGAGAEPAAAAARADEGAFAGEVAVPKEMVAQIAQRVVAQISEKVVREVAWEVIPDLAEALIRKEIDRLKAELQQI